tara:strand:+ start:16100 stop:16861 length:762 start_codon:yes stop_codon:yes gene_type:complete
MLNLKKVIKFLLPNYFIVLIKNLIIDYNLKKYEKLSNKEIFGTIYKSKIWNDKNKIDDKKFNSGPGTDNIKFVIQYVKNLENLFKTFKNKPIIADVGCGDFEIGSKLVEFSSKYYAIDVFEDLINFNKKKFLNLKVDFLTLDITKDDLPYADVYILRTVLQHLSNKAISNFLLNMKNKCKFLIITEHLPDKRIIDFTPNKDITSGPYIRLYKNSGVDLTKKPFNLKVNDKKTLFISESKNMEGILDTTLLEIK